MQASSSHQPEYRLLCSASFRRQVLTCPYTAEGFLDVVRRYTDTEGLTQHMVMELIDHIEVDHAERSCRNGTGTQKIKIFHNCVGAFEVPDWKK